MFASIFYLFVPYLYLVPACLGRPEPQCSSFHYEEKLLEKMIRTEIKVEEMVGGMRASQQAVTDAVGRLDSLRDFERKWGEFEDEMKQTIDDRLGNLKAITEQRLAALEAGLKSLDEGSNGNNVAFRAKAVISKTFGVSHIVVFTLTDLNIGNSYDVRTGMFTAPVDGIYSFSAFLCVDNNPAHFAICKNRGKMLYGTIVDTSGSHAMCGSGVTTLHLVKGDIVTLEGTYSRSILFEDSVRQNMFSGHLVKQL